MKASTNNTESPEVKRSTPGIYTDLFLDFRHPPSTGREQNSLAASSECDDCDCECAPQCADCGPSQCG